MINKSQVKYQNHEKIEDGEMKKNHETMKKSATGELGLE